MSEGADGFTRGSVELNPGRIHYREIGKGDPLLFVHGWAVNGGLWTECARGLADSCRCIIPDLPFGSHLEPLEPDADLSPPGAAGLIAELIESLGLDRPTLVANDSGGAISQILVTEYSGAVGRLILTNCDALEVFPPGVFKLYGKVLRLPGAMPALAHSLRLRAIQRSPLAYGSLTQARIGDELLDSWVRPMLEDAGIRRDSRKFAIGMDPEHTLAAAERLPELEIPVLLAWGEDDRYFKIELAERLAKLIPGSRLVRIPDAVTFVSLDQPVRLANEIGRFLAETSSDDAAGGAPLTKLS